VNSHARPSNLSFLHGTKVYYFFQKVVCKQRMSGCKKNSNFSNIIKYAFKQWVYMHPGAPNWISEKLCAVCVHLGHEMDIVVGFAVNSKYF
jgi:hypothetical protein